MMAAVQRRTGRRCGLFTGLPQVGGDRLDAGSAADLGDGAPVGGAGGGGVGVVGAPGGAGRQHREIARVDPDRHVVDDRDPCPAAVRGP